MFDELKQSVRDIEFLADPAAGEVTFGWAETMEAILSPVMEKFTRQYPRVLLRSNQVTRLPDPELRGRSLDFTLGYFVKWFPHNRFIDDLNLEVLFDDRQVVAAGMSSPWAGRRRKIDLAELVDEPWILPEGPDSWNYRVVEEAFRTRGLRVPKISVMTLSVHLRTGCSLPAVSSPPFQARSRASTRIGGRSRCCPSISLIDPARSSSRR